MSLEKRTVVITGAGGSISSFLARKLGDVGYNLALLDLHPEKLSALAESLGLPDNNTFFRAVDLLDPVDTKTAAGEIISKYGRIDVLLHLVGGWRGGNTLLQTSPDDLKFHINRHIWSSFNITQAFVPYLINNHRGRVIMISSPIATRPSAGAGIYAIGKSGQEALMRTLSQELVHTGVTANLLQVKSIDINRQKISSPSPEVTFKTTPEEIWSAIMFLISDEAGTINGANIPLYGSY